MNNTYKNFLNQFDPARVREIYAQNTKQLQEMAEIAKQKGGKYRGATAEYIQERAEFFESMSNNFGK